MKFFKLYMGDYLRDTAHLSLAEHGAYFLMLQNYYATQKPLPTGDPLYRMLRAHSRAEKDAVDSVARQFWVQSGEGFVNARAALEIQKAAAQAETNRLIALEREARKKAALEAHPKVSSVPRDEHEPSTNRATNRPTNDEPNQNQSHSHSHSQKISQKLVPGESIVTTTPLVGGMGR